MGTGKKEATRRVREGKAGDRLGNLKVKGENFYRSAKRVKQLNMFKEGKAQRNADGKITKEASYQSRDVPTAVIEPNRKWFTNTRVISQESLSAFRDAVAETASNPYNVLLKTNKLPMSLIRDNSDTTNGIKKHQAKMTLESSPFSEVFGSKATRKRVKLSSSTLTDLAEDAGKSMDNYKERLEQAKLLSGTSNDPGTVEELEVDESGAIAKEAVFSKGQSKRIWNELFKTIDSSDVLLMVLDCRDPLGTRCRTVEKYIAENAPHKHLVFVLNKCDLVPSSVAATWVRVLQKEKPTCAFRASVSNPFGKGSLIALLRQFSGLHSDRKQISVGLIGYPNVGKSSVINTLRGKKTCNVAPIAGETKNWQFVTLMKRIYLIDAPGIVPPDRTATPEDILLRGAIRTEKVENPAQYIPAALARVKPHHLARTYGIKEWKDEVDFLESLARSSGRLLRGGEPDLDAVARKILDDFLRGKLPWFSPPPAGDGEHGKGVDGRAGRLGEMPRKRKRDDGESVADTSMGASSLPAESSEVDEEKGDLVDDEEDEFSGFGSDSAPSLDGELDDDDSEPEGDTEALEQEESGGDDKDKTASPVAKTRSTKGASKGGPSKPKKRKSAGR